MPVNYPKDTLPMFDKADIMFMFWFIKYGEQMCDDLENSAPENFWEFFSPYYNKFKELDDEEALENLAEDKA